LPSPDASGPGAGPDGDLAGGGMKENPGIFLSSAAAGTSFHLSTQENSMSRFIATLSLAALLAATSCISQPSPKPMPNFCGYHLGMKLEEVPMEGVTAKFRLKIRCNSKDAGLWLTELGYKIEDSYLVLDDRPNEKAIQTNKTFAIKRMIPNVSELDFQSKEIAYEPRNSRSFSNKKTFLLPLYDCEFVFESPEVPLKSYLVTADRNEVFCLETGNGYEPWSFTLNKTLPKLNFTNDQLTSIEYPISMFGADDIELLRLQVETELGLSFVKIPYGEAWRYEARSPDQGYKISLNPTGMQFDEDSIRRTLATLSIQRIAKQSDLKLDNRELKAK
jgi:hypothetical protein